MRLIPASTLFLVVAVLAAACGVGYGSAPEGNEFFKSAKVTGDFRAGLTLTGAVTYESNYPIEVQITCEIRKGKELVQTLATETIPALPSGNPKATPFPGNFSYDFAVPEPGTYKFECLTTKDDDNYIIRDFTVRAAPDSPPPTIVAN
ncbi:MAG: hypothetical protein ABI658_32315 [Acidimicrobiales bacterium]